MTFHYGERFSFGSKDSKYFNQIGASLVLFPLILLPSETVGEKIHKEATYFVCLLDCFDRFPVGCEKSQVHFLGSGLNQINRFD